MKEKRTNLAIGMCICMHPAFVLTFVYVQWTKRWQVRRLSRRNQKHACLVTSQQGLYAVRQIHIRWMRLHVQYKLPIQLSWAEC